MVMKNRLFIWICCTVCLICGCSDFTEIEPKGKSTLNRVEDLNLVLNSSYSVRLDALSVLINDVYPQVVNIPNLLDESIKTLNGIAATWDETSDRAALTQSDYKYTGLYNIIGKIANPVLLNADHASGDRALANRYKAEALVLRAWCHYLLVNIYAKAYDPATAATDPGIMYTLDSEDITATPNEKRTVAKIYELILADLDAALELKSLAVNPDKMRVGLPFAHAVKAKVLMSMRDYDGAFAAAGDALKLKNTIDDYNDKVITNTDYAAFGKTFQEFTREYLTCEEELFETPYFFFYMPFSPEFWEDIEENHIFRSNLILDDMIFGIPMYGTQMNGVHVPYLLNMKMYYSPLGLTTVDMYLVQAECYIREGKTDDAMDLLNTIREKRVVRGTWQEVSASTPDEAFEWLRKISRTENFFTPKNFINLKRWNTEGAYAETLHKTYRYSAGIAEREVSYQLRPDSPLWIYPFPQNATNLNPNLTQNYK